MSRLASIRTERHGRIIFNLTSEVPMYNNLITNKRVEDGSNIQDHIQTEPDFLEITGTLTGTRVDVSNNLITLRQMRFTGALITYSGKKTFPNAIIKNMTFTDPAPGSPAVVFNITLQTIRIVQSQTIEIDVNELTIPDLKRQTSRGQQAPSTFDVNAAENVYQQIRVDSYERKFRITGREEQLQPPIEN